MIHYVLPDTAHRGMLLRDAADIRADFSLLLSSLRDAKRRLATLLSLRQEQEEHSAETEEAFLDGIEEAEREVKGLSEEVLLAAEELRDALWVFGEGRKDA